MKATLTKALAFNSPADNSSNDGNSLALNGTAAPQSIVDLFDGNSPFDSTRTDSVNDGNVTTGTLADGASDFTSTATDNSAASAPLSMTIVARDPTEPEVTSLSNSNGDLTGSVTIPDGPTYAQGVLEFLGDNVALDSAKIDPTGASTLIPNTFASDTANFTALALGLSDNTGVVSPSAPIPVNSVVQSLSGTAPAPFIIANGATAEIHDASAQSVAFEGPTGTLKL